MLEIVLFHGESTLFIYHWYQNVSNQPISVSNNNQYILYDVKITEYMQYISVHSIFFEFDVCINTYQPSTLLTLQSMLTLEVAQALRPIRPRTCPFLTV